MYKWFLAWRYLYKKWITTSCGVASVTLCVAMLLVVMSVMGGFLDTVRARSRGLLSEIVLDAGSHQGFPYYEEFGQYLNKELPAVVRLWTPAIHTYGTFRVPAIMWTKPVRITAIRLEEYVRLNDFAKGLPYEKYYPGTTTLGPQWLPIAGDDLTTDRAKLPPELEEANARWRAAETDQKVIANYDESPFVEAPEPYVTSVFAGERVYCTRIGEPGYVGPERYGLIVGTDVLHSRGADGKFERHVARGADVALATFSLSASGNLSGEPPITIPLRYVDDSRTGVYEIDSFNVYVDFDLFQQKLAMDPQPTVAGGMTKARANQLQIGLWPGVDLDEASTQITAAWRRFRATLDPDALTDADAQSLSYVEVRTWEDMQRPFIAAVEKEKVLVTILFGMMCVVAIFLVGLISYMIVEKKTRDIGILKSLGASSPGVSSLFLAYAGIVGILGALLGIAVGAVFVWYINDIQDFLASLDPQLRVWSPDVYSFDTIPNVVKIADAWRVGAFAVVASMFGAMIPAILAGCVWPVRALRYE